MVGCIDMLCIVSLCVGFESHHMNVQCNLIQELMLYKLELGHNIMNVTKNICCAKDEDAVDKSTVTRWSKKFCSGCKNLDNQARSGLWILVLCPKS